MSEECDRLLRALDAAPDDTTRHALIAGCPRDLLKQLHAVLAYREMEADVAEQLAAYEAFTAELDAAPDDDVRVQFIEAAKADPKRGPAFVAEWTWRRTATLEDSMQRYFALIGGKSAA